MRRHVLIKLETGPPEFFQVLGHDLPDGLQSADILDIAQTIEVGRMDRKPVEPDQNESSPKRFWQASHLCAPRFGAAPRKKTGHTVIRSFEDRHSAGLPTFFLRGRTPRMKSASRWRMDGRRHIAF